MGCQLVRILVWVDAVLTQCQHGREQLRADNTRLTEELGELQGKLEEAQKTAAEAVTAAAAITAATPLTLAANAGSLGQKPKLQEYGADIKTGPSWASS